MGFVICFLNYKSLFLWFDHYMKFMYFYLFYSRTMADINEQEHMQKRFDASKSQLQELWIEVSDENLMKIVNRMKTVIWNRDAMLVSGTDKNELETVWRNFVQKRLWVENADEWMTAIKEVAEQMSQFRNKERCGFYYLLANKFWKLDSLYE